MKYLKHPLSLLIGSFVIIYVTDRLFGISGTDSSYFWFAEALSFFLVGIYVCFTERQLSRKLPWLLASLSILLFSLFIFWSERASGFMASDSSYKNPVGYIYEVEHGTIPYGTPFGQIMKDYLLESDIPELLKTQLVIFVPLLAGYLLGKLIDHNKKTRG